MSVTVDEDGETRAHERFVIAAPIQARMLRVALEEGDFVRQNQTIAELQPLALSQQQREEVLARIQAAEANERQANARVQHAREDHEQARRDRDRAEVLARDGIISVQVLEQARNAEITAGKELDAANFTALTAASEVKVAKAGLLGIEDRRAASEIVTLRSPISGRVLSVVEKSERVVQAGVPLVIVGDPHKIEIVVDVLTTDAVNINAGSPVFLEAWGGSQTLRAKVRLVEPEGFTKVSALGVEEKRVNVIADFVDPPGRLGDGYRVEARIVTWQSSDVLKIPASAAFRDGNGWSVFVLEHKTAHKKGRPDWPSKPDGDRSHSGNHAGRGCGFTPAQSAERSRAGSDGLKMKTNRTALYFLLLLSGIALFFCYLLVAPFLKPVVFAMVLAIIFRPVHARIHRRIRNRNTAALLSTAVLVLMVTLASTLLGQAIVSGLQEIYQSLSGTGAGKERLMVFIVHFFDRAIAWTGHYLPLSVSELQRAVLTGTEGAVGGLLALSGNMLTRATSLIVDMAVTVFVLFFLLRDGRTLLRKATVLIPLRREQIRRLFAATKTALYAIVHGMMAIAAIQGALTGVAFWILGLAAPVLWGVIAGLCALLPVIGTTFVLLPAVCMLLFSGHWVKAIILLVWGFVVVHPVDNVLRPYLIGERARLSMLMVFFALFGGLKAFGPVGLFLGPLILSITVALFTFLREERRAGNWIVQSPEAGDLWNHRISERLDGRSKMQPQL